MATQTLLQAGNTPQVITLPVADVIFRPDLYPRIKHDPALVQKYTNALPLLPPIRINQNKILIDGWHRWTAHKSADAETIAAVVTETKDEGEVFALACETNSSHGAQMNAEDKRSAAVRMFSQYSLTIEQIAKALSWRTKDALEATKGAREEIERQQNEAIFGRWLACQTQQEIADAVGVVQQTVADRLKVLPESFPGKKSVKLSDYAEDDWTPPIYNVWTFGKKSNEVGHFGNSEATIVDRLLYLYTSKYDVVFDPFAGGGSTIDVCQRRLRRYYVSDRKPIEARKHEIREHDITAGLPRLPWGDVALAYLDPPYWAQAEGQYSNDPTDLANMPLDQFTDTLAGLIKSVLAKLRPGAHLALIIQPTQWKSEGRQFTDHVGDMLRRVKAPVDMRFSVPYQTEQYNAQQVEWAKANKRCLVITREVVVWRAA